jgi:hypothetical protein
MTMLNTAPTAASAPNGAAAATAVSLAPVPVQPGGPSRRPAPSDRESKAPELHILGSGALGATSTGDDQTAVTVPLDEFAKQGGPDVSVKTASGVVSVHAVFQLDAKTRHVSVAIVNEEGQLVRMIPPESVSRMIAAMAMYRGR